MENMKKCPFCGNEILGIAKKCKYCGQWLEIECPFCAETIPANTKICPHCNSNLEDLKKKDNDIETKPTEYVSEKKKICPFCGSEIPANTQKCKHCGEWLVTQDKDKPKADWHLGAWIEGLIALIIVIWMFASSFEYNDGAMLVILLIYIALHLYFLPSLIADNKRTKYTGAIFALNLLLGATGIVWIGCLIWALILPDLKKNTQ